MNIKDILTAHYDRKNWQDLLCQIFKSKAIIYEPPSLVEVSGELAKRAFKLGEIKLADYEMLAVYEVELTDHVDIVRNRRGIRDMLTSDWKGFYVGALVISFRKNESILRFSYVSENFDFNERGEYIKTSTDTKRFTYLLGEGYSCRTAVEQFVKLSKSNQTLADVTAAFNVEALSKEFFSRYKDHYTHFVDYMVDTPSLREEFIDKDFNRTGLNAKQIKDREEKPIRDYVKKLLGRIVFLHFLQKKGWLGVPADGEWGDGKRDFMFELFNEASEEQKQNFLDEVLKPLFSDGLDTDRKADNHLFDTKVSGIGTVRIPYLNGGLFERDEMDEKPCSFPPKLFEDLLDTFSQYNFTIDENDPNDAEVGVDPEMLGRIFENLLEDNKDKGAYYTPKEIVQYMCRESLIAYLQTDENAEVLDGIRQFVTKHDANELSSPLQETIGEKLRNVKICDPAIGSGAFPMGLLRELFFCRCALDQHLQEKAADIKRDIIQSNIYGVDIERGAVDIARLRFWLSLVVDEKDPTTLPNLDFKIMQGNSLLESYMGVDLSDLLKQKKEEVDVSNRQLLLIDDELDILRKWLNEKINLYYSCGEHQKRQQLRHDIEELVRKQLHVKGYGNVLGDVPIYENSEFFLWHTWFNDVFSREGKEGFDIVIGNPPYISAPNQIANPQLNEQRSRIVDCGKYNSLNEKWDLYIPFMELGLSLLRPNGVLSMIVPYPLSNQKYAKKMRKMLTENYCLLEIVDLNGTKIFENATVSNCIPFVRKCVPNDELIISHISEDRVIAEAFRKATKQLKSDDKTYVWNLTEESQTNNKYAHFYTLGDLCYISKGMVVNAHENLEKGAFKKKDLISDTQDSIHSRKYIEAKDMDKYQVKRVRYLEWNTERCPQKLSRPTFRELYDCPKLMINSIGTINATIDVTEHFLHNHSINCAVPWKELKGVKNKSISSSVKKLCRLQRKDMEKLSEDINIYFLLGILNSSSVESILAEMRGGALNIYPEQIRHIPIPVPAKEVQETIGDITKEILQQKANNEDCQHLEQQLNVLVEQLYNS